MKNIFNNLSCPMRRGSGCIIFSVFVDEAGVAYIRIDKNESPTKEPGTFTKEKFVKIIDILNNIYPESKNNDDAGFYGAISDFFIANKIHNINNIKG